MRRPSLSPPKRNNLKSQVANSDSGEEREIVITITLKSLIIFLVISSLIVYGLFTYWNTYLSNPKFENVPSGFTVWVTTDRPVYGVDELVAISGRLDKSEVLVQIGVKDSRGNVVWIDQALTDKDGNFKSVFRLSKDSPSGKYTVYATYGKSQARTVFNVESSSNLLKSTITLRAAPSTAKPGDVISLKGSIYPRIKTNIKIEVSAGNGDWILIGKIQTDKQGEYNYEWRPNKPGIYAVRASWTGDSEHQSANSQIVFVTVKESGAIILSGEYPSWLITLIILIIGSAAVALLFLLKRRFMEG